MRVMITTNRNLITSCKVQALNIEHGTDRCIYMYIVPSCSRQSVVSITNFIVLLSHWKVDTRGNPSISLALMNHQPQCWDNLFVVAHKTDVRSAAQAAGLITLVSENFKGWRYVIRLVWRCSHLLHQHMRTSVARGIPSLAAPVLIDTHCTVSLSVGRPIVSVGRAARRP